MSDVVAAVYNLSFGLGSTYLQIIEYLQSKNALLSTTYIVNTIKHYLNSGLLVQPFGNDGPVAITSRVMPIIDFTSGLEFRSIDMVVDLMDKKYTSTTYHRNDVKNTINNMVKMNYFDMEVVGNKIYIKLSSTVVV